MAASSASGEDDASPKRIILLVTAAFVFGVVGLAGMLRYAFQASPLNTMDEARLRAIAADPASSILPADSILVDSGTEEPCGFSNEMARVVRLFRTSSSTDNVFKVLEAQLTGIGWALKATKRPPNTDFAGEAFYEKSMGGWAATLRVTSYVEPTPHLEKFDRPDDWNIEIDIRAPPAVPC
jgi:hypothetical protein